MWLAFKKLKFRMAGHYSILRKLYEDRPSPMAWSETRGMLNACGIVVISTVGDHTNLALKGERENILTPREEVSETQLLKIQDFLKRIGLNTTTVWSFL